MRYFVTLALLALVPTVTQAAPPAAIVDMAADGARAKAADDLVQILWPLGTYRKMMDGQLSKVMDSMINSMFDMKAGDIAVMAGEKDAKAHGDESLGQMAEKKDPHFRDRMRITMDVMMKEMIPLMDKAEPLVRSSLAKVYARDFTTPQLIELRQMFSTPTGKLYGERWMMSFTDPEMMMAMQSFAPEIVKAMPGIMKKVEAATAHLPPPPKEKQAE